MCVRVCVCVCVCLCVRARVFLGVSKWFKVSYLVNHHSNLLHFFDKDAYTNTHTHRKTHTHTRTDTPPGHTHTHGHSRAARTDSLPWLNLLWPIECD